MPTGDTVTADWYHELNGYTFGDMDPWEIRNASAWFTDVVNSHDTTLELLPGGVAGVDTYGIRAFSIECYAIASDASGIADAIADLRAAFAPGWDVELHAMLPNLGHVYCTGRARGIEVADLSTIPFGHAAALCRFDALDPTINVVTP